MYVAVGTVLTITSDTTSGGNAPTHGDVIKYTTASSGGAQAVPDGTAYDDGSTPGTSGAEVAATAQYTMTAEAVTFTVEAP